MNVDNIQRVSKWSKLQPFFLNTAYEIYFLSVFFLTEIRLKDGTKHQGWEGVIVLKVMIPPCQKVTMRKCGRKIMLK